MLNKIKSAFGGKKILSAFIVLMVAVFALVSVKTAKADEAWDLTGTYTIDFVCTSGCSGIYTHQMDVTSMNLVTGDFSGTGNYYGPPTWTIMNGNVSGSNVDFTVDYDSSSYYVDVAGTIASDGSMSGTAGNASQAFTWSTTAGLATFNRHAVITEPLAGDVNTVNVNFGAYLVDNDEDYVDWAVRQGTCAAGTNTVFGNVDTFSDPYTWVYDAGSYTHTFTATANTSSWPLGMYCFVLNPREDSGESNIRLTREFQLVDNTAPIVTIDSPEQDDYLKDTVDIYGTIVEDRELSHYNISIYNGSDDYMDFTKRLEQQTVYLLDGFSNQVIYQWDTSSYPAGEYLIRLAARDKAGNRDLSGSPYLGGDDSQHVIKVYVAQGQVHGGGQIIEETGDKQKDWFKISFGGAVYDVGALGYKGEWEVNFHNVSVDALDKSKFHGTNITDINFFGGNNTSCYDAVNFTVLGEWNGNPGYKIIFRAGDFGSLGKADTVRVTLYDGSTLVYDTWDGALPVYGGDFISKAIVLAQQELDWITEISQSGTKSFGKC